MPAPWLVPLLGGVAGFAGSVFSAKQAQGFAERMSSTAHQRQVEDLRRAGLNPMLSARMGGASTPSAPQADVGGGVERGISSALAARAQKAQIELLEAQGEETRERAWYTRVQNADLQAQANAGRYDMIRQQVRSQRLTADQQEQLLPLLVQRAREEIALTRSSAERVRADAELLRLQREGHINIEAFEKQVGEMGPWMRLLFEFMRSRR